MHKLNNEINLDRAQCAADNASKEGATMRNSSKKTPWHLRFAPGAILRPIGRLVSQAVSLASAIIQPVRQRLNQWNWRKKTALVTALAITAGGTFAYQYKANAAWPAIIAASYGTDFFVKLFTGYAITQGLNAAFDSSILKETAVADSDTWLYRNREYLKRTYYYGDAATRNGGQNGHSVDAQAMANQLKAYDTRGTDSSLDPTSLYPDEVLDDVSDNANLTGRTDGFKILVEDGHGGWEQLYTDANKYHNARQARGYTKTWGGYVKEPTDAEIQADLDQMQEDWNNARTRRPWQRPMQLGRLKLGERTTYKKEQFTCDKEVKLWSDFEHIAVPGAAGLSPTELEEKDGHRSTYVTKFSYKAREAGYDGSIVTKIPKNERLRHEYPEPMSWCDDNFLGQKLTQIPWSNFKIIDTPSWVGRAKRFFKHKKIYRWCLTHNKKHGGRVGARTGKISGACKLTTRHEYPVYQNENVKKPSN